MAFVRVRWTKLPIRDFSLSWQNFLSSCNGSFDLNLHLSETFFAFQSTLCLYTCMVLLGKRQVERKWKTRLQFGNITQPSCLGASTIEESIQRHVDVYRIHQRAFVPQLVHQWCVMHKCACGAIIPCYRWWWGGVGPIIALMNNGGSSHGGGGAITMNCWCAFAWLPSHQLHKLGTAHNAAHNCDGHCGGGGACAVVKVQDKSGSW